MLRVELPRACRGATGVVDETRGCFGDQTQIPRKRRTFARPWGTSIARKGLRRDWIETGGRTMIRYLAAILLPAALFLLTPTPAAAQWGQPFPQPPFPQGPQMGADLSGTYINKANGGECYISRNGRGYTFVNENGDRARFVFVTRDRLEQVSGQWDRNVVATVTQDRFGRTVIRFDAPRTRSGYWVLAD